MCKIDVITLLTPAKVVINESASVEKLSPQVCGDKLMELEIKPFPIAIQIYWEKLNSLSCAVAVGSILKAGKAICNSDVLEKLWKKGIKRTGLNYGIIQSVIPFKGMKEARFM